MILWSSENKGYCFKQIWIFLLDYLARAVYHLELGVYPCGISRKQVSWQSLFPAIISQDEHKEGKPAGTDIPCVSVICHHPQQYLQHHRVYAVTYGTFQ